MTPTGRGACGSRRSTGSTEELAEAYGTEPARDTIVDAIGMELRGEARAEGRRGCKDGFAAYDVMAAAGAPPLGIESVR